MKMFGVLLREDAPAREVFEPYVQGFIQGRPVLIAQAIDPATMPFLYAELVRQDDQATNLPEILPTWLPALEVAYVMQIDQGLAIGFVEAMTAPIPGP